MQAFTLCLAAAVGITLIIVANRIRLPSIALLLVGGVLLGPEVFGLLEPDNLGGGLQMIVSLVVAIILFEGGLTLNVQGARQTPVVIARLLTLGVLITWWGTALTLWLLFPLPFEIAVLCGSLVIVTGPTVVSPLLRRIGVSERIKHILYWEAVLIDVVGVFIAVLCLEWISPEEAHAGWSPVVRFAYRSGVGLGIGLGAGLVMIQALRANLVPDEHLNIFMLAGALLCFSGSELVLHESGILAVIVAGLSVGLTQSPKLHQLKQFKLELAELGIGTLFILLSATLRLEPFRDYGWPLVATLAIILFVLRPLNVMTATYRRSLPLRERAFLAWISPRGIVAAFMASLFAIELSATPEYAEYGEFLQVFTFAVIGSSVILQGLTAPMIAGLLGVRESNRQAWLLVGEPVLTESLATALHSLDIQALVVSNTELQGTTPEHTLIGDPTSMELIDDPRVSKVGAILVASAHKGLAEQVTQRWHSVVGRSDIHGWSQDKTAHSTLRGIDLPSDVGTKIERGEAEFVSVLSTGETMQFASHQQPIFVLREGGGASLVAPNEVPAKGVSVVVLRNLLADLEGLIAGTVVVPGVENSLSDVIEALVKQAAELDGSLDSEQLLVAVNEKSKAMPSGIGAGIAIPHAYAEGLDRPRVLMALVPEGTSDVGPDGATIHIVALLVSPAEDAAAHLQALAAIARLGSDTEFLATLKAQETAEALQARLRERCR